VWSAIVVAAGRGTRFGRPKQLVEVAGKPMLAWSLETLASIDDVRLLVVTTEPENVSAVEDLVATAAPHLDAQVIAGGEERQDSVRLGVERVVNLVGLTGSLLVHDGARPMVRADDVRRGMAAVADGVGALLAVRVVDTIKEAGDDGRVIRTHDRSRLWSAQTPQFARTRDFARAHREAARLGTRATDDATLMELLGMPVVVVEGSEQNFKVTLPGDLERAELILRARAAV